MTEAQRTRLYFPRWNRNAFPAAWEFTGGKLKVIGEPSGPRQITLAVASEIAQRRVAAPTKEDLRHACTALAVQREREYRSHQPAYTLTWPQAPAVALQLDDASVSSDKLGALGLDLCLAWFDLLEDDLNLDANLNWDHPENLERSRQTMRIERYGNGGYIARVCADMYGTPDWHSLSFDTFASFYRLLLARPGAWAQRAEVRGQRAEVRGQRSEVNAEPVGATPF